AADPAESCARRASGSRAHHPIRRPIIVCPARKPCFLDQPAPTPRRILAGSFLKTVRKVHCVVLAAINTSEMRERVHLPPTTVLDREWGGRKKRRRCQSFFGLDRAYRTVGRREALLRRARLFRYRPW